MDIKRSVTILPPDDSDLHATVAAFQRVQQDLSETAYNGGRPLSALALLHAMYRRLSAWQRRLRQQAAECKAQEAGMVVAEISPAYAGQTCSRCGLRGVRKRHAFTVLPADIPPRRMSMRR
jgi:hypothetical protein